MVDTNEQINLLDNEEVILNQNNIDFIKSELIEVNSSTWEEMFDGFDEIKAITFSSGIDFMVKLLSKFEHGEVIFGNRIVVNNDIAFIMAYEEKLTDEILKNKSSKELFKLKEENKLNIYISKGIKSHEKIYLLKSKEGKYRVITGSANMSFSAFKGNLQRENIIYYDSKNAYDYFLDRYKKYKESCSDEFTKEKYKALILDPKSLKENLNIPIINTIEKEKLVTIEPVTNEEEIDDTEFVLVVNENANNLKPYLPKKLPKTSSGLKYITADDIRVVKQKYKEKIKRIKIKQERYPKLHIDYDNKKIFINDEELNLNPSMLSIKQDLQYYMDYLDKFSLFTTNEEELTKFKEKYWKFTVWFLASPFFPYLRYMAKEYNYSGEILFPTFAILYGNSNGGKTSFSKFLGKMVSGKSIEKVEKEAFTQTRVLNLKANNEGVPIIIDDITGSIWSKNKENVIKNDDFGLEEKNVNYPSIVLTTNSVPSLEDYISKRVCVFYINQSIDKEQMLGTDQFINITTKQITNNFWKEFARRMFEKIDDLITEMENGIEIPDIFKIASSTIIDIMKEHELKIPNYIHVVSCVKDYFSSSTIGEKSKAEIEMAWNQGIRMRRKCFKINKKENILQYILDDNNQVYNRLRNLQKELPKKLNPQIAGNSLFMNLDEANKYFDFHRR